MVISLFLNKDKTPKSPLLLLCFCMGIVFCVIFGIMYALLTDPLHAYVRVGGETLSTSLHSIIIALCGTAACCSFFVLRDKRIVPGAFVFLAVFLAAGYLMTIPLGANDRELMRYIISLYGLAPVLLGNVVSWGIYLKIRKKKHLPSS